MREKDRGQEASGDEIRKVLMNCNIPPTAEALQDVLFDYAQQSKQLKSMAEKYEKEAKPNRQGSIYLCPECNHMTSPRHSHCHWCGKRLGWSELLKGGKPCAKKS